MEQMCSSLASGFPRPAAQADPYLVPPAPSIHSQGLLATSCLALSLPCPLSGVPSVGCPLGLGTLLPALPDILRWGPPSCSCTLILCFWGGAPSLCAMQDGKI